MASSILDANFPRCSTATDFTCYVGKRAGIFSSDEHQIKNRN